MRESLFRMSEIRPERTRGSFGAYIGINEFVDGC
jgi:hypothetical protein